MERRDWSLKALEELNYLNSLDPDGRAEALISWVNTYLPKDGSFDFDLEIEDLVKMAELFSTNLNFLKKHKEDTRQKMSENKRMKKFLNH